MVYMAVILKAIEQKDSLPKEKALEKLTEIMRAKGHDMFKAQQEHFYQVL